MSATWKDKYEALAKENENLQLRFVLAQKDTITLASRLAKYEPAKKEPKNTKWRQIGSDKVSIEYALTRVAGYIICAVRIDGKIGLSFCSPADQSANRNDFDLPKSIEIASQRLFIRDVKFTSNKEQLEKLVYTLHCNNHHMTSDAVKINVPGKVSRALGKKYSMRLYMTN